jgi:hypothetical protein
LLAGLKSTFRMAEDILSSFLWGLRLDPTDSRPPISFSLPFRNQGKDAEDFFV